MNPGAAALAVSGVLRLDDGVAPGLECLDAVQSAQQRLLEAEDLLGLVLDDGLDQSPLVAEVVVELGRAGHTGGLEDVLGARARDAAFVHQLSGRRHDAVAGGPPFAVRRRVPVLLVISSSYHFLELTF